MSEKVVIGSVEAVIKIKTKPDKLYVPEGIDLKNKDILEELKRDLIKELADTLLLEVDEVTVEKLKYELEE